MRVDIQPYWKKLANWYWDNLGANEGVSMSIWDMIEHDYGARKIFHSELGGKLGPKTQMIVEFPDEQTYTLFALRWS